MQNRKEAQAHKSGLLTQWIWRVAGAVAAAALTCAAIGAQEMPAPKVEENSQQQNANEAAAPVQLTLKHTIELALQNSKDIQVAKIQTRLADHAAQVTKSEFLPNVYAGSGAGYTYGIPETPGGRAPSVFSVTYTEQVFNEPLRGQGKEQQEQAKAQKIILEDARNSVIV